MSRAVVVGGGIAGVSISWRLASRGVAVTLLERTPQLCSGATWHAAGLVTRFGGSPKIKNLPQGADRVTRDTYAIVLRDLCRHLYGPASARVCSRTSTVSQAQRNSSLTSVNFL